MPPQPTLHTERLVLRPFTLDDAPTVQRLAGAREVADTTLTIPHPYLDGEAEAWISAHREAWEKASRGTFAIVSNTDGLVGAIGLHFRLEHRRAELGYWVGLPFWNRGYATEAARAVIRYAFSSLPLDRIHAAHLTRNPASGRVMIKAGMQFEGVRRQHVVRWGRAEDLAEYAILRPGWQE